MRSALMIVFVVPLLLCTGGCFFGLDGSLVAKRKDASISEGGPDLGPREAGPDLSIADLPAIDLPVADQPITEGGTDLIPGEGGATDGPDLGPPDSTGG